MWNILDRRADFGKVAIVYGARTVADLVYKQELAEWGGRIPTAYGGGTSSGYPSVGRLPTANGGGTSSGYPSVGRKDVDLTLTVDPGGETPDWKGKIAFVPTALKESAPSSENCTAVVCGPPIMIKLTMPVLRGLGFEPKDIYTTLENRMKCGVGKCGRCNAGGVYVCKDGPVFTLEQFQSLPQGDL
ncbi:MAG: hypothetical protein HY922_15230 [Elusimicrobia bacterium]|nr:hypothetical protein [Elusimicrobiota bacterium]